MRATRLYSSPWYDVSHEASEATYKLILNTHTPYLTTRELPLTFSFLARRIPSILYAQCRNDGNLPFSEEVRATELGHLFEHILLEYACMQKLKCGYPTSEFSGRTDWNWKRDPRGVFHITIDAVPEDRAYISQALEPANMLMMGLFRLHTADSPERLSA